MFMTYRFISINISQFIERANGRQKIYFFFVYAPCCVYRTRSPMVIVVAEAIVKKRDKMCRK